MRRRISDDQKRNKIIGIKVKDETRKQLHYIARREATQMSTYIDALLVKHINEYFSHAHIDWNSLPDEEKEGSGDQ